MIFQFANREITKGIQRVNLQLIIHACLWAWVWIVVFSTAQFNRAQPGSSVFEHDVEPHRMISGCCPILFAPHSCSLNSLVILNRQKNSKNQQKNPQVSGVYHKRLLKIPKISKSFQNQNRFLGRIIRIIVCYFILFHFFGRVYSKITQKLFHNLDLLKVPPQKKRKKHGFSKFATPYEQYGCVWK